MRTTRKISSPTPVLLLLLLSISSGFLIASAQQGGCSTSLTFNGASKRFTQCRNLQAQGASFAWTFFPENRTLDMAFSGVAPSSSGWVGWGYNPKADQMVGSTALIAFQNSSGAHLLQYNLASQSIPTPSTNSPDLKVLNQSVDISDTSVRFSALLQLNQNSSNIFHVWNRGPGVSGDAPQPHSTTGEGIQGHGQLNIATGTASLGSAANLHLKNAHGILNALSWGILLPLGAMFARYLRPFGWADPTWFYLHASCQTLGYILGVVGWAIGLRLGSLSKAVVQSSHRNIGITLFVFATLQVFAMFLRPNKNHSYRLYWNIYHHSIGYTTIILAIINIYKGFDILQPASGWKHAYTGIIVALGVISLILEAITWIIYLRKRSQTKATPLDHHAGRANGNTAKQEQPRWDQFNPQSFNSQNRV